MIVTHTQICILGGGFAGIYTALYLNKLSWKRSPKPEITLVDQNDRFLFTPFLYELVTEELDQWEIAPPYLKLIRGTKIQFCRSVVQQIDLKNRQVQLQQGKLLSYDWLVLALGREASLKTISDSDYAFSFRTLADAQKLNEKLQSLEASNNSTIRVAIAGGGSSGVELAGKLADRLQEQGHIYLIERGEKLLKSFTTFSQKIAFQALAERGVKIHLKTKVQSISSDSITLEHQGQIKTIPVDLILWTVGTRVNQLLRHLSSQQNHQDQLITLPTLQILDHPEVFALGDLANIRDHQGKQIPTTAQAAYQQASCAAYNLQAAITGRPLRHFRYIHLGEMLTLGTNSAIVSSLGFINLKGRLAHITRRLVYLLLRMPTLRHRIQVSKHWLARLLLLYFSGGKSTRQTTNNRSHSIGSPDHSLHQNDSKL
ncbi:MAG: NAD(P)/FAD-dependent oxidoreductase [Desmonostoc vinosum HA7617-LM4]|jgi:NADH dehydrogenase|nr:NAD(P)/FAD-dependent oxidoreductase [Desmonostoc vinosum HA7617-LM4]